MKEERVGQTKVMEVQRREGDKGTRVAEAERDPDYVVATQRRLSQGLRATLATPGRTVLEAHAVSNGWPLDHLHTQALASR